MNFKEFLNQTFIFLACIIALTGCSDNTMSESTVAETSADSSAPSVISAESRVSGEDETIEARNDSGSVSSLTESGASGVKIKSEPPMAESSTSSETLQNNSSVAETAPPVLESSTQTKSETVPGLNIKIGNAAFSIILYDNASAQAFSAQMPLTLNMDELNGNEKYYYLADSLPTDSQRVGTVNAGELMLYGSDCLVLFYKSFPTSYSYTKLGYIKDTSGLADALGSGGVQVTFSVDSK